MRIVMLTQFFPPIIGGIERHVKSLAQELVKRGHEVHVVTLWQKGLEEAETIEGVRIHRIRGTVHRAASILFEPSSNVYAPPLPDPEIVNNMRKVLKAIKPDVIHAHNWLAHSFLPLKRSIAAPLVVTLHTYDLSCPKWILVSKGSICDGPALGKCFDCLRDHYGVARGTLTLFGSRLMGSMERRMVDLFIPVSQACADGNQISGTDIPHEVIPNFIADVLPTREDHLSEYITQLPDEPFMLFVGAFGKHKGFDILLQSYEKLNTAVPLVLIGYEIGEFAIESVDLPPNVHVFKSWPNEAVLAAFRRCSIAVVPSNMHEPSPTVVMEAMASGRAVVASAAGGIVDIIADGETGLLVPPGNVNALHDALKKLLDDPARRDHMGKAGLERVKLFQAQSVVTRLEAAYVSVVKRKVHASN